MRLEWWSAAASMHSFRQCPECRPIPCKLHGAIANLRWHRSRRVGNSHPAPHIDPRVRLPQAKDVPEFRILQALGRAPERWHTHWYSRDGACRCEVMPSLGCCVCNPELAAFPEKVLHAKLCSMERRKLITGYGGVRARGDWQLAKEGARLLCVGMRRTLECYQDASNAKKPSSSP